MNEDENPLLTIDSSLPKVGRPPLKSPNARAIAVLVKIAEDQSLDVWARLSACEQIREGY